METCRCLFNFIDDTALDLLYATEFSLAGEYRHNAIRVKNLYQFSVGLIGISRRMVVSAG